MTYCILSILTIISFVIYGKSVENTISVKSYWQRSILPICLYCITLGFRHEWAVDYVVYDSLYMGTSKVGIESYEPLFRFLVSFLSNALPNSSVPLFVLEAFVFIISILYLLSNYRKIIVWALPLFYCITAYQAANLVRYFIAISFVYMSIPLLLKKKWKECLLLFMVAFLIHYSAAILIFFILLLYRFPFLSNVKINICLYTLLVVMNTSSIQQALVSPITNFILMLNLGTNQLAKYANEENVSTVLLGSREVSESVSFLYSFCTCFIGYIFIIKGYKFCKGKENDYHWLFLYNLGVLGVLLMQLSFGAEVFSRIAFFFYYTVIIILSYIGTYRKALKINNLFFLLFVISILYNCYYPIKGLYSNFDLLYVWD